MFFQITHANGMTSEIPVDASFTIQIKDSAGAVVGAVSFEAVTAVGLADVSLYGDVPAAELPIETSAAVAAEAVLEEPVVEIEPEAVVEETVPVEDEPPAKQKK